MGVVAPKKVEVIAELTGSKARIRVEAEELRQGVCHTEKDDYVITAFPQDEFQQVCHDSADMRFRPRLGGTIRHLGAAGPTPRPGSS